MNSELQVAGWIFLAETHWVINLQDFCHTFKLFLTLGLDVPSCVQHWSHPCQQSSSPLTQHLLLLILGAFSLRSLVYVFWSRGREENK